MGKELSHIVLPGADPFMASLQSLASAALGMTVPGSSPPPQIASCEPPGSAGSAEYAEESQDLLKASPVGVPRGCY